jgi:DNA-binding transcriptional ArsR family regulator
MASPIDKFEELARVFYALSNKTRLRIMTLLADGEMDVTSIYTKLKLPQNSVSTHLRWLRIGGLVVTRPEGPNVFYSRADLCEHSLGEKSTAAKARSNAARFGPMELAYPEK